MRASITATLVTAVAAAILAAPPALAEERTCRGTIGATTVDNLRVPDGATCTLKRTRVEGTVKVERGARLKARSIRVKGNIQAEGAAAVNVRKSRVRGSIQVVQGGGARISRNKVNADVQFFENTGKISITANRIGGNLQCKENGRGPTGGDNVVQGNKEDQCARL
jgi:hypothetical protein